MILSVGLKSYHLL